MGEIADDCYDRALDELERYGEYEDDYGWNSGASFGYGVPFSRRPARRAAASSDDFDVVAPDDFSDLV